MHALTRSKRAGSSVSGVTFNSPRSPWGLTISPMATSRSEPPPGFSAISPLGLATRCGSPRTPVLFIARPAARAALVSHPVWYRLLDDFEDGATVHLRRVGVDDRADRPRRPSLLADDLAEVGLRDPQLDHRHALTLHFGHVHTRLVVHQRLRDVLHQLPHYHCTSTSEFRPLASRRTSPSGASTPSRSPSAS